MKAAPMRIQLRHSFRKFAFSHPTNIPFFVILAAALFIVMDGVLEPRVKDGTSVEITIIAFLGVCYALFLIYGTLICSIIFLLRRKLFASLCYLAAAGIAYGSCYAAVAIKGDRFIFQGGPHREIASLYAHRSAELDLNSPIPRLVPLGKQCHPAPDQACECWIILDPEHKSGVEQELGGWHRPTASIFLDAKTAPIYFVIVNVRRLDAKAYSVLSCDMDLRPWIPQ